MGRRYFTLLEAEAILPEIERLLRVVMHSKQDYETADRELLQLMHRVSLSGGMVPPRERMNELRNAKNSAASLLKNAIEQIEEAGVQLKDVDIGLVDFPTLYRNQEVYLCWKLGEAGIGFWHHVEDGYRGRQPIDSEFLKNHKGDPKE